MDSNQILTIFNALMSILIALGVIKVNNNTKGP